MADELHLRPFRVRLERLRRDEAFVIVQARDDEAAKAAAIDQAPRLYWTFVASGLAAAIAPVGEEGHDA